MIPLIINTQRRQRREKRYECSQTNSRYSKETNMPKKSQGECVKKKKKKKITTEIKVASS